MIDTITGSGADVSRRPVVLTQEREASVAAERSVDRAVQLRCSGTGVLYDDQRDQGDLLAAAELTTAHTVNTTVQNGGGLVAVALIAGRIRELGLKQLPIRREGSRRAGGRTPLMVRVEARTGVSTGMSAEDRACTIPLLADPASACSDLVSPGHVLPLAAAEGGLLERFGQLDATTRGHGSGGSAICRHVVQCPGR